jgi:hypothetical protein
MNVPAKLYKTHSLRKGGVTAMLAAKVSLPQIQLMARWVSPNIAHLYSELSASTSTDVLIAIRHRQDGVAVATTTAREGILVGLHQRCRQHASSRRSSLTAAHTLRLHPTLGCMS